MKGFFVLSTLISFVMAAAVETTCNANDCLRQVRASNFPTRPVSFDCSTYQTTFSTPASAATSTKFVLPRVASAITPTSSSKTIPSYASSCINDAAYRSACSCQGFTSTIIETATTTTSVVTSVCSTIVVKATDTRLAGKYFVGSPLEVAADNPMAAQKFEFRNGKLYAPGSDFALANTMVSGFGKIFVDGVYQGSADYTPLICSIAAHGALTCKTDVGSLNAFLLYQDQSEVRFGDASKVDQNSGFGVVAFTPLAEPACN